MAVHILGLWELGYNTPLLELDVWQYPLREFNVNQFYMSPCTGVQSDRLIEVNNPLDVINKFRRDNIPVVFIDERGSIELQNFVHPENVLYVFGKVSQSAWAAYGTNTDQSVFIKTLANTGMMWPHQCAVTLLYDRMNKCQLR